MKLDDPLLVAFQKFVDFAQPIFVPKPDENDRASHAERYEAVEEAKAALREAYMQAGLGLDDETVYLIKTVGEQVEQEKSGFWLACSGCRESSEGYVSPKLWPRSAIFRTQPGAGCRECGGIGVIWEDAGPPKVLISESSVADGATGGERP